MIISTKGLYGTRAIVELAIHHGKGPMGLKTIANRQEIPLKYLERLVQRLRQANIVASMRGANGGYTLTRPPNEITVREVVLALEGEISAASCLGNPGRCHRVMMCVTRDVWGEMQRAMLDVLESTSVADLVANYRKKQGQINASYCI